MSGFTLAEVLITLGIIGIVAALTIPALIGNYQKKETVNKLKKTYSIFNQAIQKSELEYAETEYWDFTLSSADFYTKYLKPHLNVIEEYIYKPLPQDMDYHTLSGGINNAAGGQYNSTYPKVFLNDGTFFTVMGPQNNSSYPIVINLNGYTRPNCWGKDIFAFSIVKGKGYVPYGLYTGLISDTGELIGSFGDKITRDKIIGEGNSRACNKNKDGIWCSALIMYDGWEISKDYPW